MPLLSNQAPIIFMYDSDALPVGLVLNVFLSACPPYLMAITSSPGGPHIRYKRNRLRYFGHPVSFLVGFFLKWNAYALLF